VSCGRAGAGSWEGLVVCVYVRVWLCSVIMQYDYAYAVELCRQIM
jgi:hypothetical protein